MATAAQFRAHATLVKSHHAAASALAAALPEWAANTGLSGGGYGPLIVSRLRAEEVQIRQLAETLASLADELDKRADACIAYQHALKVWRFETRQWQRRIVDHRIAAASGLPMPHPGPPPLRPRPPFPEAEAA